MLEAPGVVDAPGTRGGEAGVSCLGCLLVGGAVFLLFGVPSPIMWVPLFFLGLLGLQLGGGLSGFCWVPVDSTFRLGVGGAASQAARN